MGRNLEDTYQPSTDGRWSRLRDVYWNDKRASSDAQASYSPSGDYHVHFAIRRCHKCRSDQEHGGSGHDGKPTAILLREGEGEKGSEEAASLERTISWRTHLTAWKTQNSLGTWRQCCLAPCHDGWEKRWQVQSLFEKSQVPWFLRSRRCHSPLFKHGQSR